MESIGLILSANIKARRKRLGWNQAELASRSGLTVQAINRIETGKAAPRASNLELIASALGCTTADLYRDSNDNMKVIQQAVEALNRQAEILRKPGPESSVPVDILEALERAEAHELEAVRAILGLAQPASRATSAKAR